MKYLLIITAAITGITAAQTKTVGPNGEGITDPAAFKAAISLQNVDNTSDANKPISTATQTALDGKLANSAAAVAAAGAARFERIENFHGLMAFMGELMKLDQSTLAAPKYVGVTAFGDSMASGAYVNGMLYQALAEKYGVGACTSPNLGGFNANGNTWSYTGGASTPAEFSQTPGANWLVMPAGSTAATTLNSLFSSGRRPSSLANSSYLPPQANFMPMPHGVRKVSVYYVKESGAGTIEATLSQTQHTDQVLSADANATAGMGKLEFTPTDGFRPMTVTLAASVAQVRVIGIVYWGYGGVIPWSSQSGGSTMTQQAACLSGGAFKAAYAEFAAELNTTLVIHQQRVPGDASWQTNYPIFFDALAALNGGRVSQLVMGEAPIGTEGSPTTTAINAFLRTESNTRGFAYIDQTALLGSYSKIAALGWNITILPSTTDTVHLGGLFYRYIAGRIMAECQGFENALSSFAEPSGIGSRYHDRFRKWAMEEQRTRTMHYMTGFVPDGQATGGTGYAIAVDNEKGVRLTSGTAIGHAVCRIGSVTGGSASGSRANINLAAADAVFVGKGLRNLNVPANTRAWIAIGMHTTAITSVSAIAERCFGLEFAWGPDVGSPDSADTEVVRIFCYDGTSMNYSAWVDTAIPGQGSSPITGFGFALNWDSSLKRIVLSTANQDSADATNSIQPRASLAVPSLTTNSSGAQINTGIHATVAPAAAGELSWQEITARVGQLGAPYASYAN